MSFFARLDSNGNVVEYPVFSGIIVGRFPELYGSETELGKETVLDENSTLPSDYVYVHYDKDFIIDTFNYEYSETTPTLREDGLWYRTYNFTERSEQDKKYVLENASVVHRQKRDELLAKSDWIMMPDSPIPEPIKQQWIVYRKALRDIPQQPEFPKIVNWPIMP